MATTATATKEEKANLQYIIEMIVYSQVGSNSIFRIYTATDGDSVTATATAAATAAPAKQ